MRTRLGIGVVALLVASATGCGADADPASDASESPSAVFFAVAESPKPARFSIGSYRFTASEPALRSAPFPLEVTDVSFHRSTSSMSVFDFVVVVPSEIEGLPSTFAGDRYPPLGYPEPWRERGVNRADEQAQLLVGAELSGRCGAFSGIDVQVEDSNGVTHRFTVGHGAVVCDSDLASRCARELAPDDDAAALEAVLAREGDVRCELD